MVICKNIKGHYIVEVAIVLPIFLLSIISIGYLMKVSSFDQKMTHALVDEGHRMMIESYRINNNFFDSATVKKRLINENKDLKHLNKLNIKHIHENSFNNGLIEINCSGSIAPKMPIKFKEEFQVDNRILCRAFIGNSNGTAMSFGEMESNGKSEIVYIFPLSGTKYHREACTYVDATPVQMILDDELKQKYTWCETCKSKSIPQGGIVYCFNRYGNSYHRINCSTIKKAVIGIEKYIALDKGYTPCSKCGGG
ncbi:MAG: hypothetical protein RSB99_03220 [Bacilli bacterium]